MIIFELFSSIAAFFAGLPELYFYIKLQKRNAKYALMSLSVFLAFFFHGFVHLLHYLEIFSVTLYLMSLLSSALVLLFAIQFYYNQSGEVNGN